MKKETIFNMLMAVNEKLLRVAEDLSQNVSDFEGLSSCVKSVKTVVDSVVKLALQKENIERMEVREESSHAEVQMNTVFDIVLLEDMVQRARERFKDDLHLIEHHQNSVEVIKKSKEVLNKMFESKSEDAKTWHIPKTVNDSTLFSMEPLPHDAQNLEIFTKVMLEVGGET